MQPWDLLIQFITILCIHSCRMCNCNLQYYRMEPHGYAAYLPGMEDSSWYSAQLEGSATYCQADNMYKQQVLSLASFKKHKLLLDNRFFWH